jgi:hypothetical protein
VEDADLNRKAHDFTQGITALGNYAALNPMVMAVLQTPQAAKAIIEAVVRYFKIEDKQAFLGSAASQAMMLAQQRQQMMQMMQMMGPGAMAGGPGAPPPGSPPAGAPPAPSPMSGGPIQ